MSADEELILLALEGRLIGPALADRLRERRLGDRLPLVLVGEGVDAEAVGALMRRAGFAAPEVPGYELLGPLGGGASGSVWKARRAADGDVVALKLVSVGDRGDAARFLREARAAQAIDHPHVVRCREVGETPAGPFLALDFLAGGDAERLLRAKGRLDERRAMELARDAAAGLGAIHAAGLLHRDLKPANLMLDGQGGARIADLGLARTADERFTRTGAVLGTPAYMAPEQARGDAALDVRCDVYSLGATLYALVTGQPPFSGRNAWEIVGQVAKVPAPDPASVHPGISTQLRTIIRCAMAQDPAVRYASAGELHGDLLAVLAGGAPQNAGRRRVADAPARPVARPRPDAVAAQRAARPLAVPAGALAVAGALLAVLGFAGARWLGGAPATASPALAAARLAGTDSAWAVFMSEHPGDRGIAEARTQRRLHARLVQAENAAEQAVAAARSVRDQEARERRELERLGEEALMLEASAERLEREAVVIEAMAAKPLPQPAPVSVPEALVAQVPAPVPAARAPAPAQPAAPPRTADPSDLEVLIDRPCEWVSFDPSRPGHLLAKVDSMVIRSEDGGRTRNADRMLTLDDARWPEARGVSPNRAFRVADPRLIYLPLQAKALCIGLLSRDGGKTFAQVPAPWTVIDGNWFQRSVLLDDGSVVCVRDPEGGRDGDIERIFRTADGGRIWKAERVAHANNVAVVPIAGGSLTLVNNRSGIQQVSDDLADSLRPLIFAKGKPIPAFSVCANPEVAARLATGVLIADYRGMMLTFDAIGEPHSEHPYPQAGAVADNTYARALAVHPRRPDVWYLLLHGLGAVRSADRGRTWFRLREDIACDEEPGTFETRLDGRAKLVFSSRRRLVQIDDDGVRADLFPTPVPLP